MPDAETFRRRVTTRIEAFSRLRRRVHNSTHALRLGGMALAVGVFTLLALSGYLPNAFVNLVLFAAVAGAMLTLAVKYLLRRDRFRGHMDEAFRMEELEGDLNSRLISALDFAARKKINPLMQVVLNKAEADLRRDFEARVDRSPRNRFARRAGVLAVLFVVLGLTPWFGFARVIDNFADTLFAIREVLFPTVFRVARVPDRPAYALGERVRVQIEFAAGGYRKATLVQKVGQRTVQHELDVDAAGVAKIVITSHVESEHLVHFEFGRRRSDAMRLIFADVPILENMQTELVYPAYTRLLPRSLEGPQSRLFALAGTKVTFGFTFSKALAEAKFVWDDDEELPLEVVGRFASTSIIHARPRTARLKVRDIHGFELPEPFVIDFEVQQDEKPQVFLPNTLRKDMPVLADGLKLFGFGVRLRDDFGLNRCMLKWTKSTVSNPMLITQRGDLERLISPSRPKALVKFDKIFESLSVQPGDRISFKVEVYDNRYPTNQMAVSPTKSVFVYQQGLEEFGIAKLGFTGGRLGRSRIAKSKRARTVLPPMATKTKEKVWNPFEAKIETTTKPPRITGRHAPAVWDYFRLFSTAVQDGTTDERR